MLSRVADSIYWMNRYLERAENYARFIDVNFNLALERHPDVSAQWRPLVEATGDWSRYEASYRTVSKEHVIRFLGFDADNANSIYNSVLNARENARASRAEITKEVWHEINALYYAVREAQEQELWAMPDPREYFVKVKRACQLIWGLYDSTISQSEGWHFSRIGRLLERADQTSRILDIKYLMLLPRDVAVGSTFDLVQWTALLKSVSAFDMYKKHHGMLTSMRIIEYLIFDRRFPRSIYSCLTGVERSLRMLSGADADRLNPAQKKLGQIRSYLEFVDFDDIIARGMHQYLDDLQAELNALAGKLYETFFSVQVQLARPSPTIGRMSQWQSQG